MSLLLVRIDKLYELAKDEGPETLLYSSSHARSLYVHTLRWRRTGVLETSCGQYVTSIHVDMQVGTDLADFAETGKTECPLCQAVAERTGKVSSDSIF